MAPPNVIAAPFVATRRWSHDFSDSYDGDMAMKDFVLWHRISLISVSPRAELLLAKRCRGSLLVRTPMRILTTTMTFTTLLDIAGTCKIFLGL